MFARMGLSERGCGSLDPPSVYVVGPMDETLTKGLRQNAPVFTDLKQRIHVLKPYWKSWVPRFRGYMMVDRIEDYVK